MNKRPINIKMQPTVIIGLGGTGMNTIIRLKRRIIEEFGAPLDELRFLLIDTDDPEETLRSEQNIDFTKFKFEQGEFLKAKAQDITKDSVQKETSIKNWFPNDDRLYNAINEFEKGARAVKALGRLALFWNYANIKSKLPSLFNFDFQNTFDQNSQRKGKNFSVYVVGSLAGGTGAGMFLDIGYLLKQLEKDGEIRYKIDVKGLFVLGDLYSDKATERTIANSYASLKELNHHMLNDSEFLLHYPNDFKGKVKNRPFDYIYLFGSTNGLANFKDSLQLSEMLAQYIFINSSSSFAEHIERYRVNISHYNVVIDENSIPYCYSSFGICIIRFPWQQILDLCAYKFSQKVIKDHFLKPHEIDSSKIQQYVDSFIKSQCLVCSEESRDKEYDISRKLLSIDGENEISKLEQLISRTVDFENDKIDKEIINPIKNTHSTLIKRITEIKQGIDDYIYKILSSIKNIIKIELKTIISRDKNSGILFAISFCKQLKIECEKSIDFVKKELKEARDRESKQNNTFKAQVRQLQDILNSITFFNKLLVNKAAHDQVENTLKAMKNLFLNELYIIRYTASYKFFDKLLDPKGVLRSEGLVTYLNREIYQLNRIKNIMDKIHKDMDDSFEKYKKINNSEFDWVVYDNEKLGEFHDIYDPIDNDSNNVIKAAERITQEVLDKYKISIDYIGLPFQNFEKEDLLNYRNIFMEKCKELFIDEIEKYNVEERIQRSIKRRGPDHLKQMQTYYDYSNHFAVFDHAITNYSRFSEQKQTLFMIGLEDKNQSKLPQHFAQKITQLTNNDTGNFITTRDKHQIIIFREIHGFPAYMLKTCRYYRNCYMRISSDRGENPLQMVSGSLVNYEPPTSKVIFKHEKLAIEGLVLGVIISDLDSNRDSQYMLVNLDDRKRRKKALNLKDSNKDFEVSDFECGIKLDRNLDSTIHDKIQREEDSKSDKKFLDILSEYITEVKKEIKKYQHDKKIDNNLFVELFQAYFHECPIDDHTFDKNEIKRIIEKILWADYKREDIKHKPDKSHKDLLDEYLSLT